MNNLPTELTPIQAYYYDSYTIRIDMYEGYSPSGVITMDVTNWGKLSYTATGAFNSETRRITIGLSQEEIQGLPPVAKCRIKDGDQTLFNVLIKPTKDGQAGNSVGYSVSLNGEQPVVIELNSREQIEQLVEGVQGSNELAQSAVALANSTIPTPVLPDPTSYQLALPDNLYYVNNDINAFRKVISSVYLDNMLLRREEVRMNKGVSVPVTADLVGLTFEGLDLLVDSGQIKNYQTKRHTPVLRSANASAANGKKVALLTFGDSKSGQVLKNKYGVDDITWIAASQFQLNMIKDSIDSSGAVKAPVLVGAYSLASRTGTYKTTNDVTTRGGTFAIGSWCVSNFLRHAMQLNGAGSLGTNNVPAQTSYYLLGLRTVTGLDWTGSQNQIDLIRTTCQGKNPPDYNSNVWDYLKTRSGWTGGSGSWVDNPTNRGYIDSWLSAKYQNPDNAYFSLAKAQTVGSTNAFDLDLALSRYKTLSDVDFTTRLVVGSTAGSKITSGNINTIDVCTPTHVTIQGGENDRSRFNSTADVILSELTLVANLIKTAHPEIIIGMMVYPEPGVLFPESYSRIVHSPRSDTRNDIMFDLEGLMKAQLGAYSTQQANKLYHIPAFQCMAPFSNQGDAAGYDALGELMVNGLTSDTNNAIHPGLIAQNSIGDLMYAWIYNTLT